LTNSIRALGYCRRKWQEWHCAHAEGNVWSLVSTQLCHQRILNSTAMRAQFSLTRPEAWSTMSSWGPLSDIKKGNAGKLALTVVFKETTERGHILLYIMLFLIQHTVVRPPPAPPLWWWKVWTSAKVFFTQPWNIHTMVGLWVDS